MVLFCSYVWHRNGAYWNMNVPNIKPATDGTGSFVIDPATSLDTGSYQCIANTTYGTALSNTSILLKSVLRPGEGGNEVNNITVRVGEPFYLPVTPLKCFPPPSFTWVTGRVIDTDQTNTNNAKTIKNDGRVQTSDTGKSHPAILADC